jgi:hypothetical protein
VSIEALKAFGSSLEKEFDLSKSRVKSGILLGGLSRKDGCSLDKYISYKDQRNDNLALAVRQRGKGSPLFFFLDKRAVGTRPTKVLFEEEFTIEQMDEAFARYRAELTQMLMR